MSWRDVLEAQACRKRRESLEKASISLGHSNLLGVLTGLAAVDALAKRDVSTSLEAIRERAQAPERGAAEHNRTFPAISSWYRGRPTMGAARRGKGACSVPRKKTMPGTARLIGRPISMRRRAGRAVSPRAILPVRPNGMAMALHPASGQSAPAMVISISKPCRRLTGRAPM